MNGYALQTRTTGADKEVFRDLLTNTSFQVKTFS